MRRVVAVLLGFLVFIGFLGWGPYQKYRLDREVDRLCAIDGGVRIYETVTLSKENFGPNGEVFPQFRRLPREDGRYGSMYQETVRRETVFRGDLSLTKSTVRFTRKSDGKVLAEQINYVRGGGDFPGPAAPSSHQCKQVLHAKQTLISVFSKEQ